MNNPVLRYLAPGLLLLFVVACSSTKPAGSDPVQQELLIQLKALTSEIGNLQMTQAELLEMRTNLAQMDSQLTVYRQALTTKEQDTKSKESEIIELRGNIDVLTSEIQSLRSIVDTLKTAKDSLDQRLQDITQSILPRLEKEQAGSAPLTHVETDSTPGAITDSVSVSATPASDKAGKGSTASSTPVINKRDYRRQYNAALNKYFQRDYISAIKLFRELIKAYPEGIYADNCQYWIGESYYSLENYQQAIEEFSKVSSFPENNKADHALFKIGMSYLQLGKLNAAEDIFHKVIENYPESDLVPRVREYFAGKKM